MLKRTICLCALSVLGTLCVSADMHVSTSDAMKAAVAKPAPEYTAIARQMKVAGHVEIETVISSDGSVENATAVTGNPLLTQSAVNAVKKWKFTPFKANGEPTRAVTTLAFDFKP